MEPSEIEFLAEKELITVIPNFSEHKILLISVDYCTVRSENYLVDRSIYLILIG